MSLRCARCLMQVPASTLCRRLHPALSITPQNINNLVQNKNFVRQITTETKPYAYKDDGILKKWARSIKFSFARHKIRAASFFLYEKIADTVDYDGFIKELNLPDTFQSWFLLTELHVWMIMSQVMADPDRGRMARNAIVEALWQDVGIRINKLDSEHVPAARSQVREMSQQFQAALISYDEGLLSDDKVLAGAIWRRLFNASYVDPQHLEAIVKYIRKTMYLLDKLNSHEFIIERKFNWSPVEEVFSLPKSPLL